jgi:hypothetical protein
MIKIAAILSIIHLVFYFYYFVGSDIIRRLKFKVEAPGPDALRLMKKYKVDIRMFHLNNNHYGFSLFNAIYINSKVLNLRKKNKKDPAWVFKSVFHHEHYHLMHHHKALTLLMRFIFSLVPLLLIWHWLPCLIVYAVSAWGMDVIKNNFESKANAHAHKMMKI